jgi:tetratricopeptide (TPR) repeat protein
MSNESNQQLVLEDWAPLANSLHFHLGQFSYYLDQPVQSAQKDFPSLSNQGMLAGTRAADVLFANCEAAEEAGELPESLRCIEVGMGDGSFGLQLLDRFQDLCTTGEKDYYDRLTWYATDDSPNIIFEVDGREVYERHAARVQLGRIDLLEPKELVLHETREVIDISSGNQALFMNFVLSALPAEVWNHQPDGEDPWQGAMVRLMVDDWVHFSDLCPFTQEAVVDMANEPSPENMTSLSEIYTMLKPEFTLGSADIAAIPGSERLQSLVSQLEETESGIWILDSEVARLAITQLLESMNSHGMILVRDFGPGTSEEANQSHCYRNFGSITAFPVNFWQIDQHFADASNDGCSASLDDEGITPRHRLYSRQELAKTSAQFRKSFGAKRFNALADLIEAANAQASDPANYLQKIMEAIELEPMNWKLISEAATYALSSVEDPDAAVELAVRAAQLNPAYAAEAWKVLGDVKYWIHHDLDLAAEAYTNAAASDPSDPMTHLGLQLVYSARKDHAGSLIAAASAVAEDEDGVFHDHAIQVLKTAIDDLVSYHSLKQKYQNNFFPAE